MRMLWECVPLYLGCTDLQPCCCASAAIHCSRMEEKKVSIKMSPSRFELETLSVLDSRDNRLHHGDHINYKHDFFCANEAGCKAAFTLCFACADANKENVDEKGKAPLLTADAEDTGEGDDAEDDDDEDDANEGDAGDMQVRNSDRLLLCALHTPKQLLLC